MVFETRPCAFCGKFAGFADDSLGPLLGPVVDDRSGKLTGGCVTGLCKPRDCTGRVGRVLRGHALAGVEYYAHRLCALWSPEV